MTCPDCQGSGRIRKRFLFFFTRRARCRTCLGTGQFPPAIRSQVRVGPATRDWDDDQWPAAPTFGSSSGADAARDQFEVGSGGRSGGGGASASWDGPGGAPPVIADPFGGDAGSAVTSTISADAADPGSSADSSSSTPDGGGTSY